MLSDLTFVKYGFYVLGSLAFVANFSFLLYALLKKDYYSSTARSGEDCHCALTGIAISLISLFGFHAPALAMIWLGAVAAKRGFSQVAMRKTQRTQLQRLYG